MTHEAREQIPARLPQHVTLRIAEGVESLRRGRVVQVVKQCIARSQKADFRIVHFNVESNHIHLIIEANGNRARTSGMAGLEVSIARRVNRCLGRRGSLFGDRYHARALTTPREVRNAIRYVLLNAAKHGVVSSLRDPGWIDPCSSAAWFDGWRDEIQPDTWWKRALLAEPPPVVRPTVWLLAAGWRRHGALAFDEI